MVYAAPGVGEDAEQIVDGVLTRTSGPTMVELGIDRKASRRGALGPRR